MKAQTLVARGVSAPVRFSSDGRWVAYGGGTVVNVTRHEIVRPLGGSVVDWAWVGGSDELVGITGGGGLVIGAPGKVPRRLLPDGWGANSLAASGEGEIAVTRAVPPQIAPAPRSDARGESSASIWTLTPSSGKPQLSYQAPPGTAELTLARFAPSGGSVVFWVNRWGSSSLAADGLPLKVVGLQGDTPPVTLSTAVLTLPQAVVTCGESLVFVSGAGREETLDKRIETASATDGWRPRALTRADRSSISPSCPAAGGIVAAAAGPSRPWGGVEERRSIELISPVAGKSQKLTEPPLHSSDESPRFVAGERWVLFIRDRFTRDRVQGAAYLVSSSHPARRPIGPLFTAGPGYDVFGTSAWGESVAIDPSPER